ncbi:MAG: DUF4824 family protein [Gemmatimonadota bacterium]|nr:DUF4824 family protein [Gemmatimonadota bacterium]
MTKRPGALSAVLLVVVVNLAPLAGWWWNHTGNPLATVELSEREAGVRRGGDENSSVWLELWRADAWEQRPRTAWADSASLVSLGFEPERLATGEEQSLAAWRPRRRPAWVLLRVDEAASTLVGSRLVPVAVGPDPGALYRQSGDRNNHLVMRGVVRVGREILPVDSLTGISDGETWSAALDVISPATLHVPRSLVAALEDHTAGEGRGSDPRFEVRVTMGRFYLPRVTGIFPATR